VYTTNRSYITSQRSHNRNITIIVIARQQIAGAAEQLMQNYDIRGPFLPNGGGEVLLSDREPHRTLSQESKRHCLLLTPLAELVLEDDHPVRSSCPSIAFKHFPYSINVPFTCPSCPCSSPSTSPHPLLFPSSRPGRSAQQLRSPIAAPKTADFEADGNELTSVRNSWSRTEGGAVGW
jgi:hypothetical protein